MLKKFIAKLSPNIQNEIKRFHFRRQIRKSTFTTDEPEYLDLHNLIQINDWVIDVGANVGHYTNKFSQLVGKNGRVIAFEPVPHTFSHLSNNTLHCEHRNISLINAAASDATTIAHMSIPKFSTGLTNYYQAHITPTDTLDCTPILTLSIDDLNISKKISLIKIDAEGHEPNVVNGALSLIERDKPTLILETVNDLIRSKLSVLGYIEKHNPGSPNRVFEHTQ